MKIMTDKQFKEAMKEAVQRDRENQYIFERIDKLRSELRGLTNEDPQVTKTMFYDLCGRVRKLEDLIEHYNIEPLTKEINFSEGKTE